MPWAPGGYLLLEAQFGAKALLTGPFAHVSGGRSDMKAVVIYEGVHSPAETVARAIGDEFAHIGARAEVHALEEFEPTMLDGADMVLLGGVTRHGRADAAALGFADVIGLLLPMRVVTGAFDIELEGAHHGAADRLDERFRRLGYSTAKPGHFRVTDVHGSLVNGEIDHARAWVHEIVEGYAH